ncbi:hypothetical protein HRI_003871300 [Hibiscus trionum]|uniref:Uncharacterized protein n=1 Tax=Hibiscus trionum TaxID=183268 RepID=A0A9W7MLP3_HIBTR|nr:hypothetical protein HRI_003871300 [Hibiscus trionum]
MEAMKKSVLLANLISALLIVLVAAEDPFDIESDFSQDSEASTIFQESQYFPDSNPDEPSLLSQSEFPQDSQETKYFPQSNDEGTSLFSELEHPHDSFEAQNFPEKTPQFSESGFSQEFEYPEQSFELDAPRKIKPSPPPPPPSPGPSPSEAPAPSPSEEPAPSPAERRNMCISRCLPKCRKVEPPILRLLCLRLCERKCFLRNSVLIYNCTVRCAETMPQIFKSYKKRAAGYAKYCYNNCVKKF